MSNTVRECLLLADQNWGSAVQAARELAKAGTTVYVVNAGSGSKLLASSRYVAAATDVEPSDGAAYCREVAQWAAKHMELTQPVPVIPLSDRLVEYLDAGRGSFAPVFRLAIPASAVVAALVSKESSLALAERAGLNVPRWCVVRSVEDVEQVETLRMPVIVRPTSWSAGERPFKISVHRNAPSLSAFLTEALLDEGSLLVQEYVDAPDGAVEVGLVWRSKDGARTEVCTGVKRRQSTADGGVMAWGEAVENSEVRELTKRFVEAAAFVGSGGAEFIRKGADRWFVEFNPRPEAIHYLSAMAGVPLLQLLEHDLRDDVLPQTVSQKSAAAWVGAAWLERLRRDRADLAIYIRDRWEFVRFPRRTMAVWSLNDPGPGLYLLGRLTRHGIRSIFDRARRRRRTN